MTRRLEFLLVFCLIFLMALYYVDYKRQLARQEKDVLEKRLLPFPAEETLRIQAQTGQGLLELEREGENWAMARPLQEEADQGAVNELLRLLDQARLFTSLPLGFSEKAKYGLEEKAIRVEVQREGGEESLRFLLGKTAPVPGECYLWKATEPNRVYVTQSALREALDRSAAWYQDKTVLPFSPEKLNRFRFYREGLASFHGEKDSRGRWWLTPSPGHAPYGTGKFRGRDDQLAALFEDLNRMAPLPEGDAPPLISKAPLRLTLLPPHSTDSLSTHGARVLQFFPRSFHADMLTSAGWTTQARGGLQWLCRLPDRQLLFQPSSAMMETLLQPLSAFRNRRIFTLTPEKVAALTLDLQVGSLSTSISLRRTAPDEDWTFVQQPGAQVSDERLTAYLDLVLSQEVALFQDDFPTSQTRDTGLDPPFFALKVQDFQGRMEGYAVGAPFEKGDSLFYGRRLGETPWGEKAEPLIALTFSQERLLKVLELLKNTLYFHERQLLPLDPEGVERIEIVSFRNGGTSFTLTRQGQGWQAQLKDEPPFAPKPDRVELLLQILTTMEYDQQDYGADAAVLKAAGLTPPSLAIALFRDDGQQIARMFIGRPAPEDKRSLILLEGPRYYWVRTAQLQNLSLVLNALLKEIP